MLRAPKSRCRKCRKLPLSSGCKPRYSTLRRSARSMRPFTTLARGRLDALFVAPDAFFNSRGVQFATLSARERIPAAYSAREIVAAGGLMSYGADLADMSRQVGVYTGSILKGAKPSLIKAGLLSSCTSGWVNARLICLNADEVDSCGSWGWMPNLL